MRRCGEEGPEVCFVLPVSHCRSPGVRFLAWALVPEDVWPVEQKERATPCDGFRDVLASAQQSRLSNWVTVTV